MKKTKRQSSCSECGLQRTRLPQHLVGSPPLGIDNELLDVLSERVHLVEQRLHAAIVLGHIDFGLPTPTAILDGASFDVGKLGTMGQEMTAGMSDNKDRDVQVKNAIIDAENLRLMREQNRLLKGGS
jgi:hypothetical protein